MDLVSANAQLKTERARVRIESQSGNLRLRATLPPKPGKEGRGNHQQAIYLRLPDTAAGIKQALKEARLLSAQLLSRSFDWAEWGYSAPEEPVSDTLDSRWQEYLDQKRVLVTNQRTITAMYQPLVNILKTLPPVMNRGDAINLIQALKERGNCAETIRKRVSLCFGFYQWMIQCGYWHEPNPFAGLRRTIKGESREQKPAFTESELQRIFATMSQDPCYAYYVPFYTLVCLTGCRISEGIGLRWQDISEDCTTIRFRKALVVSESHRQVLKGCKTHQSRTFRCSEPLIKMLQGLSRGKPDDFVFVIKGGDKPLHQSTLSRHCWRKILRRAKVPHRPQMMLRHSLISHAVQTMAPVDLSKQLGHTPQTMLRYYAQAVNPKVVPVVDLRPE